MNNLFMYLCNIVGETNKISVRLSVCLLQGERGQCGGERGLVPGGGRADLLDHLPQVQREGAPPGHVPVPAHRERERYVSAHPGT